MLAIIIAALLLTPPSPPLGLAATLDNGRVLLSWAQQSDANVVCIDQRSAGVVTPRGCIETVPGFRVIDLPEAPDGTIYILHEWRRSSDQTWTSYGFSTAALPWRTFAPFVRR